MFVSIVIFALFCFHGYLFLLRVENLHREEHESLE